MIIILYSTFDLKIGWLFMWTWFKSHKPYYKQSFLYLMVEEEVREIGRARRDSNMPLVEIDEAMRKNDSSPQEQRPSSDW